MRRSIENSEIMENAISKKEQVETMAGKYHGLFIYVNEYDDSKLVDLSHPKKDVLALKEVLISKYLFDDSRISVLGNPTRGEILDKFDELSQFINNRDSLLVFYAGHGQWNEDISQGYWLPMTQENHVALHGLVTVILEIVLQP